MILATIKKDVLLLVRDRGALASMFLLPLAFITVFGLMFSKPSESEGGRDLPRLALHAASDSKAAQDVIEDVKASGAFEVIKAAEVGEVDRLIVNKKAVAGLVVPADFDPAKGRSATLVIDTALPPAERASIEGPLQGAVVGAYFERRFGGLGGGMIKLPKAPDFFSVRGPAGLRPKASYVDGFQVTVPSNAVLFCFFICVAVGLSFVEERKSGTWKRLLASPVSRISILLAKLVPFLILGTLQMVFIFAVGALGFGMHLSGSIAALALVTVSVVFAAVSLGFLVASLGGSEKQVGSITSIVVLIMGLVSGCMFPRFLMPKIFQGIGLSVPHGWALDAYRDVLVRQGTGIMDVAPACAIIAGFGVAYLAVGALIFRFER